MLETVKTLATKSIWTITAAAVAVLMLLFVAVFWPREPTLEEKLAAVQPVAQARTLAMQGFKSHKDGRLNRAEKLYAESLEIAPEQPRTHFLLGSVKLAQGEYEAARDNFTVAADTMLKPARAYNSRAVAMDGMGEMESALADLDLAIASDPEYARAYANRAILRKRQGDTEGAFADLDKALELQADSPWIWDSRGVLKFEEDDLEGAQEDFSQAIEVTKAWKNPYSNAFANRAVVREALGDAAGAARDRARVQSMKRRNQNANE